MIVVKKREDVHWQTVACRISPICFVSSLFPVTTPWFETYRENFFQLMPASEHEFLNHYLACILLPEELEPEFLDNTERALQGDAVLHDQMFWLL